MDGELAQFIRDNLDARTKLDVALFLHRNRFAVEGAPGLAVRIGRGAEDISADLREMAAARVIALHGDPASDRPPLYGYTTDGTVAKLLQRMAWEYEGPGRAAVLAEVLEGQARRSDLRLRELRRLDSLKTQFLSLMSHELRTPLTAMKGYLELLQAEEGLDAEQRARFLAIIAAQCDRLCRTVNNILLAADLQDDEGWQCQPRPLLLQEFVRHLVDEFSRETAGRSFALAVPPHVPPVAADEVGTELVIRNLLDNAVKFSLEGSSIRVWLEVTATAVLLHVGDEGIGISPDRLRAVFDRFYQVEYYCTRRHCGSGLGLYLAREIMERMGGRIDAHSELGKGSVFTCVFLIAPVSEYANMLGAPPGSAAAG